MIDFFDYQKEAIKFAEKNKKVYLAMEMGMGKTLTSLAVVNRLAKKHILLIAEKNEIVNSQNFKKEILKFFPDFQYASLRENNIEDIIHSNTRTICGINPDGLSKIKIDEIYRHFDSCLIDEATLAKTTTTKRFKKIRMIVEGMDYLCMLSGTPIMNGAAELYAPLLLLGNPMVKKDTPKEERNAKKAFETIFAGGHYKKIKNTGKYYLDYTWWSKGANNVRELRWLIRNNFFISQKENTNIFKKKERRIEWVKMSFDWIREYQKAWDEYLVRAMKRKVNMDNVVELKRLIENGQMYQVNSRWKAKQVVKDIANKKYGRDKIVLFSLYVETDKIIQQELAANGISYRIFEENEEWKSGSEQVLFGRIKAHGKGTNLPESNIAIFVDMDFVPASNLQAENRIDRPEQTRDMKIIYYMTHGSSIIDSHVRKINKDKIKRINEFMRPLTEEEICTMPEKIKSLKLKFPKEAKILGI